MITSGWTRITIVCSALWLLAVVFMARAELEAIESGAAPRKGLAILRDPNTGREFRYLSKSEIKELGRLMTEEALSEKKDSKEAMELMAATPEATLSLAAFAKWAIFPLIGLWGALLALRWIVDGFRTVTRKKEPNQQTPEPTTSGDRGPS